MDLSGNQFVYDGVNSNKYDLRFMEINTERFMSVAGALTHQTTFLNAPKRRVINGVVYSDSSPEFDVEIISEKPISVFDKREIEKWLFYQTAYKKLYVNPASKDEGEVIDLPYYKVDSNRENFSNFKVYPFIRCVFTNPVAIEYASGLHGWQCTCCTDSPFATLDAVKIIEPIGSMESYGTGLKKFNIYVDSDMPDYIFPTVKFTLNNSGSVSWKNITDSENREFKVDELTAGTILYCNSETNRVSNSSGSNGDNYYPYVTKRFFPRLLPGDNKIIVGDNITSVEITWNNRRWFM